MTVFKVSRTRSGTSPEVPRPEDLRTARKKRKNVRVAVNATNATRGASEPPSHSMIAKRFKARNLTSIDPQGLSPRAMGTFIWVDVDPFRPPLPQ